jgi:hypothetical protein
MMPERLMAVLCSSFRHGLRRGCWIDLITVAALSAMVDL